MTGITQSLNCNDDNHWKPISTFPWGLCSIISFSSSALRGIRFPVFIRGKQKTKQTNHLSYILALEIDIFATILTFFTFFHLLTPEIVDAEEIDFNEDERQMDELPHSLESATFSLKKSGGTVAYAICSAIALLQEQLSSIDAQRNWKRSQRVILVTRSWLDECKRIWKMWKSTLPLQFPQTHSSVFG